MGGLPKDGGGIPVLGLMTILPKKEEGFHFLENRDECQGVQNPFIG